jgi:hypothetical protein
MSRKGLYNRMPDVDKKYDTLVLFSTRYEGFSLAKVEAMLAECAILTTGAVVQSKSPTSLLSPKPILWH